MPLPDPDQEATAVLDWWLSLNWGSQDPAKAVAESWRKGYRETHGAHGDARMIGYMADVMLVQHMSLRR